MNIELKREEWQVVVNVLAQAPYHTVAAIIAKIQQQAADPTQTMGAMPLPMRGNGHMEGPVP